MNDLFDEYKQSILKKLHQIALVFQKSKLIDYGEVLELSSSDVFLKITLYYNKFNKFKYVINKVLPDEKKSLIISTLNDLPMDYKLDLDDFESPQSDLVSSETVCAGSDESGKGDYFGPLVVAAFACQKPDILKLQRYGVKDSKLLTDTNIIILAEKIFLDFRGHYEYLIIMPEKYNELYPKFSVAKPGLNDMLAWMHGKVIGNLHKRYAFQNVIVDKFADEKLIKYFLKRECTVNMTIITRAESNTVVAAASIIARYLFIKKLDELSNKYNIKLLKGASLKVKEQKKNIAPEILPFICKSHFKM